MSFYHYGGGDAHQIVDLKKSIHQCLLIEKNKHPDHYWPNYGSIVGTYYQGHKLIEVNFDRDQNL